MKYGYFNENSLKILKFGTQKSKNLANANLKFRQKPFLAFQKADEKELRLLSNRQSS